MKDIILYKFEKGHKFYGIICLAAQCNGYCESCKSSALGIVNQELLYPHIESLKLLVDGELIPLPSNLKFEEVLQQASSTGKNPSWINTNEYVAASMPGF